MYTGSPEWPRVFWRSYEEDEVDPGLALTEMINDSLRGRMQANAFDEGLPSTTAVDAAQRSPIGTTSRAHCGDLLRRWFG